VNHAARRKRRNGFVPGDAAVGGAYQEGGAADRRTAEEELVRVCDTRWQTEECFAQAKGGVGLNHYEVRTWAAWHRFVTLCLLAHAFLIVVRHVARQEEAVKKGAPLPA
jgi:SRSO17 transposase